MPLAAGPSTQSTPSERRISAFEEHRRIFGFKPPTPSLNKGKRSRSHPYATKKKKVVTFTKETICLKYKDQNWLPSTEERIELAKLGLGLKKIVYQADGDAKHIHEMITSSFPVLESCGGYTLLRLGENSRELIPVDGPDSGMSIPFLKDILRQAKLFVRPLQSDISKEEAARLCSLKEGVSV